MVAVDLFCPLCFFYFPDAFSFIWFRLAQVSVFLFEKYKVKLSRITPHVYRTKRKIARNDWLTVASSADNSFCNSYDRMESENKKREERGGVKGGAISYPESSGFLVSRATPALGRYFIHDSYRIYISVHYRNHIWSTYQALIAGGVTRTTRFSPHSPFCSLKRDGQWCLRRRLG